MFYLASVKRTHVNLPNRVVFLLLGRFARYFVLISGYFVLISVHLVLIYGQLRLTSA